jgi:hypothetical protein
MRNRLPGAVITGRRDQTLNGLRDAAQRTWRPHKARPPACWADRRGTLEEMMHECGNERPLS